MNTKCWNCGRTLSDAEQAMWCTRCGPSPRSNHPDSSSLDEALIATRRALGQLDAELKALTVRAEAMQAENARLCEEARQRDGWQMEYVVWRNARRRIAETLAAFYRAPLSMSSVQPLLTLAEELNPSLKVSR